MSLIRLRRLVAVLGLAGWIALLPAAASAAPEPFRLVPAGGLLAQAWDFVTGMLGLDGGVSETGAPAPTPDLMTGDQGASVDPNGRT